MMTNHVSMNPAQAAGQAQATGGQPGTEGFDFWSYLLGLQGNQNAPETDLMGLLGKSEEGPAFAQDDSSKVISEAQLASIAAAMAAPVQLKTDNSVPVKADAQSQQQAVSSQWLASNLLAKNDSDQPVISEAREGVSFATLAGQTQNTNQTAQAERTQTADVAFDAAQAAALQKYRDSSVPEETPRVSHQSNVPTLDGARKRGVGTASSQFGALGEAGAPQKGVNPLTSELSHEVPPSEVSDVFQRVETLVHQGGGKMTVTLSPPELGSLEISVTTRGKKVEIEMTSDNDAAKSVLEGGLADLKNSLQAQDLVLSKTEVRVARDLAENPFGSLAGGQQSFSGQSQSDARDGRKSEGNRSYFQPSNLSSVRSMGSESRYARSVSDGRVDIRI